MGIKGLLFGEKVNKDTSALTNLKQEKYDFANQRSDVDKLRERRDKDITGLSLGGEKQIGLSRRLFDENRDKASQAASSADATAMNQSQIWGSDRGQRERMQEAAASRSGEQRRDMYNQQGITEAGIGVGDIQKQQDQQFDMLKFAPTASMRLADQEYGQIKDVNDFELKKAMGISGINSMPGKTQGMAGQMLGAGLGAMAGGFGGGLGKMAASKLFG